MFVFLFAVGLGATAGLLGGFQTLPVPTTFNGQNIEMLGTVVAMMLLAIPIVAMLVFSLRSRGGMPIFSEGAGASLLTFILVLLIVSGIFAAATLLHYHRPTAYVPGGNETGGGNATTGNTSNPGGNATNGTASKGPPALGGLLDSPYTPVLEMTVVGIILSLVLVPLALYLVRRERRSDLGPPSEGPTELVHQLEQAVASLEAGDLSGARERIVSAYAALLKELKAEGVEDLELLTPREIEVLMETRLALSSPSAHDLRSLFEEARYSEHQMTEAQATAARRCLVEVLDQLKAKAARPPDVLGSPPQGAEVRAG